MRWSPFRRCILSIPSLKNPVLISGPLVSRRTDEEDHDDDDDNNKKVGNGREGTESKGRVRVVHECNNIITYNCSTWR